MSELFNQKYQQIITPIQQEMLHLDNYINDYFSRLTEQKNEVLPIIKDFLSNKGKRIRPALIFLFTKALGLKTEEFHYRIAMVNELLHNATLIHDDIIDCSLLRRGKKTLNFDYDSKLAVLAGDYLLSEVIKLLDDIENKEIRRLHTDTVSCLIKGELYQYFNRFKILSIENYIEKSKNKTAKLFEAGIASVYLNKFGNDLKLENVKNLALNFGIAFQVHNDLKNLSNIEKINEDIQNGDYSAPLIFYAEEFLNTDVKKFDNINLVLKNLKTTTAIEKTQKLINFHINKAIENTSFIEDNLYKQALTDLCNLYTSC